MSRTKLLVIDVGNTNTVLGVFRGSDLVNHFRIETNAGRTSDELAVLVQRGWLPRDPMDRTRIVAAPPAPGRVAILGRIAPAPGRLYEFEAGASGPIRQNLDLDAYARETGLLLRPLTVGQEDGARRRTAAPMAPPRRRRAQALWLRISMVRPERAHPGSVCLVPTHPPAPGKAGVSWLNRWA